MMRLQRSGLPLMILAAILMVAAAVTVAVMYDPLGILTGRSPQRSDLPEPTDEPAQPEPPAEPVPAPAATNDTTDEPPADPVDDEDEPEGVIHPEATHFVVAGDTLFDLAQNAWGDPYLWPVLLLENQGAVSNPDLLKPGQGLVIPGWPPPDMVDVVSRGHLVAYHFYRATGEVAGSNGHSVQSVTFGRSRPLFINDARWVLYSGLRYNPALLQQYGEEIENEDLTAVQGFVAHYGGPPPPPSR